MGQLVTVALLGIIGWFAWKAIQKESARVAERLRPKEPPAERVTTLEKDPRTGVYRPKDGQGR